MFKDIFIKYRLRFSFTLFLIIVESGLAVLFPLFIGYAIDDAMNGGLIGSLYLAGLGVIALFIGVFRRVFDSRFYAHLYRKVGLSAFSAIRKKDASKKSARLGMIRELIEFLENSLPELIGNIFGLIGVVVIIATLNTKVFYGSLIITIMVFVIYWMTSSKTISLNKSSNDEFEKQVDIISRDDQKELSDHLKEMMKWNIKLSDLEAVNFSLSWILLMTFLVFSIVISVQVGTLKYGVLLALVMYVFQYIENVIHLPMYYQSWLRLAEIKSRMDTEGNP